MSGELSDLFEQLLRAETEDAVTRILDESGFLQDDRAWRELGDFENNFSTVSNQQSDATGAMVEKIINGVDAVLLMECFRRGIDPEGASAPTTMLDAVAQFFGVRNGRIGNVDSAATLTRLAENIRLIATSEGGRTAGSASPCYLIVDTGEGQTPEQFPDTFCSLGRSNKLRIPFVQGKFNAGGTGVLQFCGQKNYQLIASRRNPQAPMGPSDASAGLWGFTLVRRLRPADRRRNSMYVYLAPGGKVPRFAAVSISVLPSGDTGDLPNTPPRPYEKGIEYGSVIKLYEYKWRARSILTTEGRYELQRYLQEPALPFRVTETRSFRANYYSATISGIWAEIALAPGAEDSEGSRAEKGFPAYADLTIPAVGRLPYQIAVFKEATGVKRREPIGVYFMLNGQVHGQLPSNFVSSKLHFDYLADSMLASVDCTGMNPEVREDFFMASRDRLRKNDVYDQIYEQLARDLKEHEGLRELNNLRRQLLIERSLADDKQALEVFQYLLKADPTLAALLGVGDRLVVTTGTGQPPEFHGRKFPSFFRLKRQPKAEAVVKHCAVNRTVRVEWETDAANDYFSRSELPGELMIEPGELCEHTRLWSGEFTARFHVPGSLPIGTRIPVSVMVTDIERETFQGSPNGPFRTNFELVIDPAETTQPRPSGAPSTKAPRVNGKATAPRLALPQITEIRRDQWGDSWDEFSALRIKHGSDDDSFDFVVNMDNAFLQTEMQKSPSPDKSLVAFWFKYGLALCALGVLHDQKQRPAQASGGDGAGAGDGGVLSDLETLGRLTDGLARVIVPVIRSLFRGPQVVA